jgi:hypothetical protein
MQSLERVAVVRIRKKVDLYYGSRKSDKFVRCYKKPEVAAYRVELEAHSGLLRHHDISVIDDLMRLPEVVCPKHFQLVELDWNRLKQHLARKLKDKSGSVLAGARRRRTSILRLQRYLRRKGVVNTHRLLGPLGMNTDISRALSKWIRKFNSEEPWANTK